MNCVHINSVEFKALLEATKLPSMLLELMVAKYQEKNGLDSFPTESDIFPTQVVEANSTEFEALLEESGLHYILLSNKISRWMSNNVTGKFPSLKDLGIESKSMSSVT